MIVALETENTTWGASMPPRQEFLVKNGAHSHLIITTRHRLSSQSLMTLKTTAVTLAGRNRSHGVTQLTRTFVGKGVIFLCVQILLRKSLRLI